VYKSIDIKQLDHNAPIPNMMLICWHSATGSVHQHNFLILITVLMLTNDTIRYDRRV